MMKLRRRLRRRMERAIRDYEMIASEDRVLVAVSGGSDSLSLLDLLAERCAYIAPDVSLVAAHLDIGFEGGTYEVMEGYFRERGYEYVVERTEIGRIAHGPENRENPCFLCARLRRKRLFELAHERGCRTVAFGHHKDDIVETFLINAFFAGEISTMVPDQSLFGGLFHAIRPLAYIEENLLKEFARENGLPVVQSGCPTDLVSKRRFVKDLLAELETENDRIKDNLFRSLGNVKMDYLLRQKKREGA